jgi:hypothetical protein
MNPGKNALILKNAMNDAAPSGAFPRRFDPTVDSSAILKKNCFAHRDPNEVAERHHLGGYIEYEIRLHI